MLWFQSKMSVIFQQEGNFVVKELRKVRDLSSINLKSSFEKENLSEDKIFFIGEDDKDFLKLCKNKFDKTFVIVFDSGALSVKNFIEAGYSRDSILAFGLRNLTLDDRQFLDSNKIKYHEIKNVEDIEFACDGLMEFINRPDSNAIITFNLSVVDPSFAPSLIESVPGGLSSRELIYFSKRLSLLKNVKVVILKGIDYEHDKTNKLITSKLGAMVVWEFFK